MSVRITSRPASPDEIALLGHAFLPPWAHALRVAAGTYLLWWFIGFGLLMMVGTAASVFSVAAAPSAEATTFQWRPWMEVLAVLVLWGPVFLLPLLVAVRRGRAARVRRRNLWADRRERRIEVVAVEDEPCTVIDAGKAGRYHLFSIHGGGTLCLSEHNHALQMAFERLVEEQEEQGLAEDDTGDEALERCGAGAGGGGGSVDPRTRAAPAFLRCNHDGERAAAAGSGCFPAGIRAHRLPATSPVNR